MIQKTELVIEMYELQKRIASLEAENARLRAERLTEHVFSNNSVIIKGATSIDKVWDTTAASHPTEPVFTVEQIQEAMLDAGADGNFIVNYFKQNFNIDL